MSAQLLSERLVVPTTDLREVLEPHFVRIEANYQTSFIGDNKRDKLGALAQVAQDASHALGTATAPSIVRRIAGIRSLQSQSTGIDLADALLMALDLRLDDCDLPVLPLTHSGARSMVDDHCSDLPLPEREKLCHSLFNFACAYIKEQAPDETRDYLHKQYVKKVTRDRKRREAA